MRTDAGIYLHVPFCSAICPYCDFAVTVARPERRGPYVAALLVEIELAADFPHSFDTLYFGGGTPSLLEPSDLERILVSLRRRLTVRDGARVHLEANPEDVTERSAVAWRDLGVRFVSLGVQSFDAAELRFLGRRHQADDARRAVDIARRAGFDTVSIDLIFGLPDQGIAAWGRNLAEAVRLEPDHLSCYQLSIHDGTHFGRRKAKGKLAELPEATQADLFEATHVRLADAGYEAYEVSNFARAPKHCSRHNRKYWDHTPYLGLGPSAHSFEATRRWWNLPGVSDWEAAIAAGRRPVEAGEDLTPEELSLEALMLGLRTTAGIDLERLRSVYGLRLRERNATAIERLIREGLLLDQGTRLVPTVRGLAIADALARAFDVGGSRGKA